MLFTGRPVMAFHERETKMKRYDMEPVVQELKVKEELSTISL